MTPGRALTRFASFPGASGGDCVPDGGTLTLAVRVAGFEPPEVAGVRLEVPEGDWPIVSFTDAPECP